MLITNGSTQKTKVITPPQREKINVKAVLLLQVEAAWLHITSLDVSFGFLL